ncbi:MAG: STAS domain-containing protein [Ignavibacteriaceae bacterium]
MTFHSQEQNKIIIVTVNLKRATNTAAEEFKLNFLNNIKNEHKKYLIDLSQCEYMDSSFLGSIIFIYKKISESDGELKVVAPHQDIKILLEITSVNKFVDVYDTKTAAIKSFGKKVS